MTERIEPIYDCIECLQGHTDLVLEKEKELIAAGNVRMFLPKVELLGSGEYVLRSFYGLPLKLIAWRKP
jgi:hypothetical protein